MNLRTATLPLSILMLFSLGLNGCSQSSTETAQAKGTAAVGSAQASKAADRALPAGHQWVTAKKVQIRFAVPSAWKVVDLEQTGESQATPMPADAKQALTAIAEAQGITFDAFMTQIRQQMELFTTSSAMVENVFSNINVTRPGLQSLPTEGEVGKELTKLGAKIRSEGAVDTATGKGYRVAYTMSFAKRTMNAEMVFIDNGSEIVQITATAGTAAVANALADTVVSTVSAT